MGTTDSELRDLLAADPLLDADALLRQEPDEDEDEEDEDDGKDEDEEDNDDGNDGYSE